MCIGTPMRIIALEPGGALCAGRGQQARVDFALIGDEVVGAWVLVHRGVALRRMSPEDAAQTLAALDALDAVLSGDGDVDKHFADLANREPTLPPHLRKETS